MNSLRLQNGQKFHGLQSTKDKRTGTGNGPRSRIWADLRHSLRLLRTRPGFSVIAILTLALGIGANAAIFQLLDALRLHKLPVPHPEELTEVVLKTQQRTGSFGSRHAILTNALWEQIRDKQQAFGSIFSWGADDLTLTAGGEALYAQTLFVSGDFFQALGVPPLRGRLLTTADDQRDCVAPSAVISHSFWQREYGGDPGVIGKKLILEGRSFEVVGITPASFFGVEVGHSFDVAIPLCSEPLVHSEESALSKRNYWWLGVIGRLKPGWSVERAAASFDVLSPGIFESTVPEVYNADQVKNYLQDRLGVAFAGAGVSELRAKYEEPLWLLLGIAGTVLLIACGNLANLLLARASAREREMAVRLALGASRSRIMQQLLIESFVLALLGTLSGALLAQVLGRSLISFMNTANAPVFVNLSFDWLVFSFMAAMVALTCLLFGLAPALRASQTSPGKALKTHARGLTAMRGGFALSKILVVGQVALALVLLSGAFLFIRSLRNILSQPMGFERQGILVANLDFAHLNLPENRRFPFKQDLVSRLAGIPGVQSLAAAEIVPVSGNGLGGVIEMEEGMDTTKLPPTKFNVVTPGYFRTMGSSLLSGRDFSDLDKNGSPKVAIVNQRFARLFLNGANPIGKRFRIKGYVNRPVETFEIVGLAEDEKYIDVKEEFQPIAFLADAQYDRQDSYPSVLLHCSMDPQRVIPAVKRTLHEVNPAISVQFAVLDKMIEESLLSERLMASLSGLFGILAALLATLGLYGTISYMVSRRTIEIGIRMSLGANRGNVLVLVLGEAGALLAVGLAIGLVLAVLGGRTAQAMLYRLSAYDPWVIGSAVLLLMFVAMLATYFPARRASGLNPIEALREE
jgi:putative ABC transport system permease protein